MKKVLNFGEAATHKRLKEVCEKNDAAIFAKIRLADVFPIEGSGITDEEYAFALKGHFDFVVADRDHDPLFAVEFDGPFHEKKARRVRDRMKNNLCERFDLPILRINANYLKRKYRDLDLLTWFVETWFAADAFYQAQAGGHIPYDEPFDPASFFNIPGHKKNFPLWLGAEVRIAIQDFHKSGRCAWRVPAFIIGFDADENYRGFSYLKLDGDRWLYTYTGMRSQRFPAPITELLSEIMAFEIAEALKLNDHSRTCTGEKLDRWCKEFEEKYSRLSFCSGG